jgi:hypothetical protein
VNYSFGSTITGGTQLPSILKPNQTTDFAIIRKGLTAGKPPRNSFDLPFPSDVVSGFAAECSTGKFFDGDGTPLEFQPQTLPLIVVLRYSIPATTVPILNPTLKFGWSAHVNFHIFAEPKTDKVPPNHVSDLLNAEQDLYTELKDHPIKFSSEAVRGSCDDDALVGVPEGLDALERASLAKRTFATCPRASGAGGHPASCLTLIVIK